MIEQELGQIVGTGANEVRAAEFGGGERFGDVHVFAHDAVLGLDLVGGDAILLQLTEFAHGFVGATLEGDCHFEGSLEMGEGFCVVGVGESAGAGELEVGPGEADEGGFFEIGLGDAVATEFLRQRAEGFGFFGFGREEGFGVGVEAVGEAVGGYFGLACGYVYQKSDRGQPRQR